ncbi:MazG-like family protein [Pseudorhodoplanes sinuspersici]|uniref:Uncharacterized protein n=1 Tax=Pseudorhodoplanes sinuspersici TaxID=1235591 RepID=A0A1W6ZX67_9HYPH|nr:MazG-like family protein [Pseudorhodoplanes sinuspersici]ARQ01906.1 hypothetical protein CAK95_24510 [Pseudorhodoplanes sinuspersici]RKE73673.1 hypothetical protein DFP91_1568 [Pseudorhodoplanes sinuspersici]
MSDFTTLRAANRARQHEWDKNGGISIEYRCNELAGEMGEACNVIKKLERERLGIRGSRATVGQLAEELADVVICVDLIAMGRSAVVPLNTGYPVGFGSAAHAGAELAKQVGWLCDAVLDSEFDVLETRCLLVVRTAYALADIYGIDLDGAIVRKFNATSEKVGLSTRLLEAAA